MASEHVFSTILKSSDSNINSTNDPNRPLMLPYPQGCLEWCRNGMILAAGGGGPTRSGKANGFEILQFIKQDGHQFELKRHSWYKTGLDIVYCIQQHPKYPYHFIAAIGNNLVIMEISSTLNPKQNSAFEWNWNTVSSVKHPASAPIQTIHIRPNIESTTLPGQEDVLWVNRVAISTSGRLIATGGTDGIVRLWKYDFVDPKNTLCLINTSINITHQHFKRLGRERKENEEIPIIERLLFYKNKYLSICNRECACYIWNVEQQKMETILMDHGNKSMNLIFRDSVFIDDGNDTYCVCAVNEVRKSRKSRDPPSYLYQYYIPAESTEDGWYRRHYCKIINADVIRMIGDMKTKNIITMHSNGIVCVLDGLNLNKLYSFKNAGMFFTDIAISPNLYGMKSNEHTEYLLSSFGDSVLMKAIQLKPCRMQTTGALACCRFKCCAYVLSVAMALFAVWIALVQPDSYS